VTGHELALYSHAQGGVCARVSVTSEQLLGRSVSSAGTNGGAFADLPQDMLDAVARVSGVTSFPWRVHSPADRIRRRRPARARQVPRASRFETGSAQLRSLAPVDPTNQPSYYER